MLKDSHTSLLAVLCLASVVLYYDLGVFAPPRSVSSEKTTVQIRDALFPRASQLLIHIAVQILLATGVYSVQVGVVTKQVGHTTCRI